MYLIEKIKSVFWDRFRRLCQIFRKLEFASIQDYLLPFFDHQAMRQTFEVQWECKLGENVSLTNLIVFLKTRRLFLVLSVTPTACAIVTNFVEILGPVKRVFCLLLFRSFIEVKLIQEKYELSRFPLYYLEFVKNLNFAGNFVYLLRNFSLHSFSIQECDSRVDETILRKQIRFIDSPFTSTICW